MRCESILMFYCTNERAVGKDRLGFVKWSSQEIKEAGSTTKDYVGLTFTAHLCPHPRNQKWACSPGHLVEASVTISMAAGAL